MIRLLFVIIIPFSFVLIGSYPDLPVASFFFSANVLLLCIVTFMEWRYAIAKELTEKLPPEHLKAGDLKNFYSIIVAAIACVLSLYLAATALWAFMLIPIGFFLLKKAGKKT